jgi:hypothetical protein
MSVDAPESVTSIDIGLNFEEAQKESGFQPIPEDDYKAQVIEGVIVRTGPLSKTPGRPMVKWTLEVIEHPDYKGRKLFYNTLLPMIDQSTGELIKTGLGFLVSFCEATGIHWDGGRFDTSAYLGSQIVIRVGLRDYEGTPQNDISKVLPA